MFGRIAPWYDFLNHSLSCGLDILWRRRMVRLLDPARCGSLFLDLAAGTLDVTCEIYRQNKNVQVVALDFSLPMLQTGRGKLGPQKYNTQPVLADGLFLPMKDASVHGVTIAFGVRNINPRSELFAEILRVLIPGGRLVILEFASSQKPICKGLYNFYLNKILPHVGRIISKDPKAYSYLAETIGKFPSARDLEHELCVAGFTDVSYIPLCFGIVNLHTGTRGFLAAPLGGLG